MKRKSPRYFANLMKAEPYSKNVRNYRMKKNKTEKLFGVPPESRIEIDLENDKKIYRDTFTVHKSAKKGQNSFRITKSLLDSLFETYKQIQKKPILVITIIDGADEYTLTCSVTKK